MRPRIRVLAALAFPLAAGVVASGLAPQAATAPSTRQNPEAEDTIHGVRVADPFRWLEDDKAGPTHEWLAKQSALLEQTLGASEVRTRLRRRLAQLTHYDMLGTPEKAGRYYIYSRVDAGQPSTSKRLVLRSTTDGSERVHDVLPPEEILAGYKPSPEGSLIAVSSANPRTSTQTLRLIRTETGQLLEDRIERSGGTLSSPQWLPDSSGFYYTAPEFERSATGTGAISMYRLFFHRIGKCDGRPGMRPPDRGPRAAECGPADLPVSQIPVEKGLRAGARVTSDGGHLVVTLQRGSDTNNRVLVQDLRKAGAPLREIVPSWTAAFTFLGSKGDLFWFYTDDAAPRGRIITIDVRRPNRQRWREVVAQQPETISARDQTGVDPLGMFGGRLLLTYVRDGQPFLRVFSGEGKLLHTIQLPPAGSIWNGISGNASDHVVFYWFLGLTDPSTIYQLDLSTGRTTVFAQPQVPFEKSRYVVEQHFYRSADGTRVPIFVAHRADLKKGTSAATWLYGYGALGWVSFIWYQPQILAWLEMGGVYAQPSLRGGGEYGAEWHQAALKTKKIKAVEDYVAAAEWLIAEGYTTSARLVANGGSLSAPLAFAAVHRRPELFGAAVIDRPVTDMVRYERFTGGTFWSPEFGSVENPDEFKSLLAFSAYHSALSPGCRPPTLVLSGELDRTAPPLHARKLVAAMQNSQTCGNPVLLKMMPGATHNFGNTPEQTTDSFADLLTFLATVLKLPWASQAASSPQQPGTESDTQ